MFIWKSWSELYELSLKSKSSTVAAGWDSPDTDPSPLPTILPSDPMILGRNSTSSTVFTICSPKSNGQTIFFRPLKKNNRPVCTARAIVLPASSRRSISRARPRKIFLSNSDSPSASSPRPSAVMDTFVGVDGTALVVSPPMISLKFRSNASLTYVDRTSVSSCSSLIV
uniref:(northern house mosquito) hypothetical protein n=1 Tax=Culex pipiens TaxID=7175 RepID=A0A8D8DT00_CULPI